MCCCYTRYRVCVWSTSPGPMKPLPHVHDLTALLCHVGVCSVTSWQCHCCLLAHTTHSPWHQLQGNGSSRTGWGWRPRRRHEDQPGEAVAVVEVQIRACTQLEEHRPKWWAAHLVAVPWHGRTALWPQALPSTSASGQMRKFDVLFDVFIIMTSLTKAQPYVLKCIS